MQAFMRFIAPLLSLFLFVTTASALPPNWNAYYDFSYGPDQTYHKADIFILKKGINPAIVFIHGGGWAAGDKSAYRGYYAEKYGWKGFNVFLINYRLAAYADPATQWNAQLQDVQLFIRWLRQNAATLRVDPTRIGVFGDSAGGQLALFLGTLNNSVPVFSSRLSGLASMYSLQSPKVSAVVDYFGPVDLLKDDLYPALSGLAVFGGLNSYKDNPPLFQDASPILFMTQTSRPAPVCAVHGYSDTIVPYNQSLELRDKLASLSVAFNLYSFSGGHWFSGTSSTQKNTVENNALNCITGILKPNPLNAF